MASGRNILVSTYDLGAASHEIQDGNDLLSLDRGEFRKDLIDTEIFEIIQYGRNGNSRTAE